MKISEVLIGGYPKFISDIATKWEYNTNLSWDMMKLYELACIFWEKKKRVPVLNVKY